MVKTNKPIKTVFVEESPSDSTDEEDSQDEYEEDEYEEEEWKDNSSDSDYDNESEITFSKKSSSRGRTKSKKKNGMEALQTIVITPIQDILSGGLEQIIQQKRRKLESKSNAPTIQKKRTRSTTVKNPEEPYYGSEEKKYYKKLTDEDRTYVSLLEQKILEMNKDGIPIRFKILLSKIDDKIKAIAIKKLSYLYGMDNSSSEYYKTINWIESLCRLPIGKYKQLPVTKTSPVVDIRNFIKKTKDILDETVYGHKEAKDQIIRILAQRISNPNSCGNVIGICSPPGCGKTLLAKQGISRSLDLPFSFISLGGLEDSSHFVGHSFTYEGSNYGKVADLLMKAEHMNPVIFFDELDKVSQTYKGNEIINLLIHMTDATQNDKFEDKYFTDVDMDLSQCLLIFSYNDEQLINPILKDRMIRINIDGYKMEDKVKIAQQYLLRDLCKQFGFKREDIVIHDDVIKYIVNNKIENEQGVRNLRRALEHIISNLNLQMIVEEEKIEFPFTVTEKTVNKYVVAPKNRDQEKINSIYC